MATASTQDYTGLQQSQPWWSGITESGLSISLAVQIFMLKLPEFIVLAFPMSTLLATMMTYSRLSSDSELIALRGCGVSIRRIIAPAVVLSLMVTGLTFVFNELITPAANYRAAVTLERALNSERPPFQERNIFYQEFQAARDNSGAQELKRQFYARRFDGETMTIPDMVSLATFFDPDGKDLPW